VEPGATVAVYWNGTRAANGDGIPGGSAAVNYGAALATGIPVWPDGHVRLFGGGFADGGFSELGARNVPRMGFSMGPFATGAFGVGGAWWEWTFDFALRNGRYNVGLLVSDWLGNAMASPGAEISFGVEAVPRPVPDFWLSAYDAGAALLTAAWTASPDFS
jgi:hypothetical protein